MACCKGIWERVIALSDIEWDCGICNYFKFISF